MGEMQDLSYSYDAHEVVLRVDCSKKFSSFVAKCTLSVGKDRQEWGAEKDKHLNI